MRTLPKIVFTALISLLFAFPATARQKTGGLFRQRGNEVTIKDVRFQFLTPSLVRMESSPSGHFLDAATAVVLKRDWPRTKISPQEKDGWILVKTPRLMLRYRPTPGPFTPENLRVTWRDGHGDHSWAPGDTDRNNLGGTLYSLDGASKRRIPKTSAGILSRSGYFLLDDSRTPVWNAESEWIIPRMEEGQDWYFFLYGDDYRHALKEYSELCGKIPMIPRYTLGAWVTDLNYEYFPGSEFVEQYKYSDSSIKDIVERFRKEDIPLDVLVLDFAWHRHGWRGGYDWSGIFPKPKEFLDWAHRAGLRISVNDHPGYGNESILSNEDSHAAEVRIRLNRPVPPQPTFSLNIAKDWRFQLDPHDSGLQNGWYATNVNDSSWKTLQAGMAWEEQGYPDYDGLAWYRKWVTIPKEALRDSLYLGFGGVDDEYDLFINGKKVTHYGAPGSSVWNSPTFTEVARFVKPAEKNLIALRVNDWGGGGGMTGMPVEFVDRIPAEGIRFNLANKNEAEVFMEVLHNPLIDEGVDFWWVDGGNGSSRMYGLNSQMWTNRVFYDLAERHSQKRGFIFSRYGGWGSHRYPAFFTGDTYSDWEVLAFQVPFTATGGNVLMPYITHDIGGFLGRRIDPKLYIRWVQFGALSPFLRLHSAHENPKEGNLRLPWTYSDTVDSVNGVENIARKFFKLRYKLIPFIYTYNRTAFDEALPLVRPLYLEHPGLDRAYFYPYEYFFGKELLVAPIVDSTDEKDVYLPPGEWIDYFTDKRYSGDQVIHVAARLEEMPLFVKAGSIIPSQHDMTYSDERPLDTLVVDIYAGKAGAFKLYEDDGITLAYKSGQHAVTPMTFQAAGKRSLISIGPTKGTFRGQARKRAYEMRIHGIPPPASVQVNGRPVAMKGKAENGWEWSPSTRVVTVYVKPFEVGKQLEIIVK